MAAFAFGFDFEIARMYRPFVCVVTNICFFFHVLRNRQNKKLQSSIEKNIKDKTILVDFMGIHSKVTHVYEH